MSTPIRIEILSPVEFEDMVAEIYLEDRYLGRITQEGGVSERILDLTDSEISQLLIGDVLLGIEAACARLDALGMRSA